MITITGATGQLGRLVVKELLGKLSPSDITAAVRNPDRAADMAAQGVRIRLADYDRPETLEAAFRGTDTLLLISSNEIGRRAPQHKAVIDAATQAGVKLIAYTSILHADTSPLGLAGEHRETEAYLKASGVASVILRNGWYTENHLAGVSAALAHGALLGSAGDGRISSAARADYAAAAAAVLTGGGRAGQIFELAGDESYTLADLAAEISRQAGKTVIYRNLSEAEYTAALAGAGLPGPFAALLADSDVGASKGGLFDDSGCLRRLIGRPTTPLAVMVRAALGK